MARFTPWISTKAPGAVDVNWPNSLALTTPPVWIEGSVTVGPMT
jgi:hypothetical protein